MCVVEPANSLIVSCGLSNGLNMLHKSRGSFLCAHRSFDHNRARILMIARVITFTAGNADLVRPGCHTSSAGIINRAVLQQRRFLSVRSVFLHNKLHFLGTTVYQIQSMMQSSKIYQLRPILFRCWLPYTDNIFPPFCFLSSVPCRYANNTVS